MQPEHVDGLVAGLVGVDAAGGLAGHGDHVRREQHREHRRVERRVGPVVPVPRLLLLEPVDGGQVGDADRCLGAHEWSPPLSALHEYLLEYVGPVGDQTIDAEVEELVHLLGLVDGPHVHVGATTVGVTHQRTRDHREPSPSMRHLKGRDPSSGEPPGRPPRGQRQEQGDLRRAGRRGHLPAAGAPERIQPPLGERADADPVVAPGVVEQLRQRLDGRGRLDVDVEPAVRELLEQLGHRRYGVLAGDPRGRAPRQAVSRARTPCRSVTRSSTGSWKASSTPSLVAWTSVSR